MSMELAFINLLDSIKAGAKPPQEVVDIDGKKYSLNKAVHLVPKAVHVPRAPDCLGTTTLQSVVDFLAANIDKYDLGTLLVLVGGPGLVQVLLPLEKIEGGTEGGVRRVVLQASTEDAAPKWLGQWQAPEATTINLLGTFDETPDLAELLSVVGNIRSEKVVTAADDGVSQSVAVSDGISRIKQVTVRARYMLSARRGFPDIQPVPSEYLLRMRSAKEGELPTVSILSIFEQKWRSETIAAVAEVLRQKARRAENPDGGHLVMRARAEEMSAMIDFAHEVDTDEAMGRLQSERAKVQRCLDQAVAHMAKCSRRLCPTHVMKCFWVDRLAEFDTKIDARASVMAEERKRMRMN